jgi:hypothetical protein
MRIRRWLASVTLLLSTLVSAQASAPTELTCASPSAQVTLQGGEVQLHVKPDAVGSAFLYLEIEETGLAFDVESAAERRTLTIPPRLGISALRAATAFDVRLKLRDGRTDGTARVRLDCDAARGARAWAWLDRASTLADTLTRGVGSVVFTDIGPTLDSLAKDAYDARSEAWSKHLHAQGLLMGGQARDAAVAFIGAEAAWREAGEPARASAALVAAVEDMNRSGAFAEVLRLTRGAVAASARGGADYYGVRLRNAGCLALRYLGRLDEAGECYSTTTQRLLELGESLELAVTSLDFGTIELDRGNLASAIDLFERSLTLAVGPKVDDERGRAEFFLADANARAGRLGESVAHLHRAMSHFERSGSTRRLGSSLLRLGALLSELGATADARATVEQGLSHFDEANAPARVAAGQLALARIALRAQQPAAALAAAETAAALYSTLKMPLEKAVADDQRLRALIDLRDWPAAKLAAGATTSSQPGAESRAVTLAELELAQESTASAGERLRRIDESSLPLAERLRLQRAWANWRLANGDHAGALEQLRIDADEWSRLAGSTASAVLRERLEQFATELAAVAVDVLADTLIRADSQRPQIEADDVFAWVPVPARVSEPVPEQSAVDARARDQQLATLLFPGIAPAPAADAAQRRVLLDALGARAVASTARATALPPRIAAAALRTRLGSDGELLALIDGRRHVLVVQLSADATSIRVVEDRGALLQQVEALNALVRRPDSVASDIRAALAAVSTRVFGVDRVPSLHRNVFLLPTGALTDVPWPALLEWQADVRADGSLTVLVPRSFGARTHAAPESIDVFVASQQRAATLMPLDGARREAASIRAAAPAVRIDAFASATRGDVLGGLETPGAWIHVAAHGTLAPGRIGGAGIWLDPEGTDGVPGYLSWLEILERGVAARVVVLNACQLGSDGQGGSGMVGFSSALLRAGAGEVVAAYWPVSDTAGAIWVTEFYRASAGAKMDVSRALGHARAALRHSRAFRHPYYWAGLVHFEAVAPGVDAAAN